MYMYIHVALAGPCFTFRAHAPIPYVQAAILNLLNLIYGVATTLCNKCSSDLMDDFCQGGGEKGEGVRDHDEKAVKSPFDPSGYDKDLVEALERDIVQKNPNVKW